MQEKTNQTFTQQDYMEQRVDDQIHYYDSSSVKHQKWFKRLTTVQIVSGAIIPFLSGFSNSIEHSDWIIAFLGLAVTCSTAFLSFNKYHEKWISYRTTCENMRHLKFKFLAKAPPYHDKDAFELFVNDIESLISKENTDWTDLTKKTDDKS